MSATDTIEEARETIVEEFSILGDWMQRYEYIIELGRALPGLPEEMKVDSHRVQGCQSRVWFHATRERDQIRYQADSDAMIVRGLIALLLRVYSGRRPDDILATSPAFLEVLGLGSHLSGSRANGLHAMVKRIHAFALAHASAKEGAEIDPRALA
jgi:cysteine desulfuration protein SufE